MPKEQKHFPPQICPACGSTWFRKSGIEQYSAAGVVISRVHMEVLVCLCGAPLTPERGGMPRNATVARELAAFFESLGQAAAHIGECHNREAVAAMVAAKLMRREKQEKVAAEASRLEREIGRGLARADKRKPARGRHWRMPTRKPATQDRNMLVRDTLVLALQEHGFRFRQARQIVSCLLEAITSALRRGEEVETPIGTFTPTDAPPQQERRRVVPGDPWRIRRRQVLFRSRKRIKFKV